MKTSSLSYDAAMSRVEEIVKQLEQSEALSMQTYKQLADEAKRLLDYCKNEVVALKKELSE